VTRSLLLSLFAITGLVAADAPSTTASADPFDSCIVSGEQLGSMGDAIVQAHEGREVRFCCTGCIKTFTKDPAKHLAIIDQGTADKVAGKSAVNPAAPKPALDPKPGDGHHGRGHDGHTR
jgi:hypothetical protein